MSNNWAFSDEKTLDQVLQAVRQVLRLKSGGGINPENSAQIIFAEVTESVSDTEVKAIQKEWDSSVPGWEDPEGSAWVWDSDLLTSNDYAQKNLQLPEPAGVGDMLMIHFYTDKSVTTEHIGIPLSGGTPSIWLTTANTGLGFSNGAKYDRPGGAPTALTVDDTFYIATPWNTRIVAPANFFGYFVQDGNDWYYNIQKFYVRCNENYPSGAGAGIDDFDCFTSKSTSSLNLGDQTAFPTGIKILLDGFDNVNAGTNSLNYFNGSVTGKTFEASFDTAANIIYLDHPSF